MTDARPILPRVKRRLWREYLRARYSLPSITLRELGARQDKALPPIMDDICMPPYASHGPKDHDDYEPLMRIARDLPARIVFEIGTAHGNSVANLCRHSPGCKVYTVNAPVEEQTGRVVTFELTPDEIGRVYRSQGFENRVTQIFANSLHLDLAKYFSGAVIDLGIVDGCHDADFVVNDFLKVQPFIRPGGVILLHDTHPSMIGHLFGSYLGCMELRRKGFDIRHLQDTWWGVWRKPVNSSNGAAAS
jgi:predicted O-methyltransferase YrrM